MAFLLAAASLPASSLFALERIEVDGLERLSAQEVIAASGLAPGARSIFLINVREVAARLGAHPRIAAAEVRARAPHSIRITVHERRAAAAAPFARGFALVDASGIVIEVQTARPLLLMVSERGRTLTWATPGQRIDSVAVREGLALLPRLPEALRSEIVHLQISRDREVFMYLRDGLEVRGGPLRGAARRLEAAPEVLRRVRADAAPLEYVDFSLAEQVVIKPREGVVIKPRGREEEMPGGRGN